MRYSHGFVGCMILLSYPKNVNRNFTRPVFFIGRLCQSYLVRRLTYLDKSKASNALCFFGGVPRCIVPDCNKSAAINATKYEFQINKPFKEFEAHYNTTILHAQLHHQDKSLAGNLVKTAYTRIIALFLMQPEERKENTMLRTFCSEY